MPQPPSGNSHQLFPLRIDRDSQFLQISPSSFQVPSTDSGRPSSTQSEAESVSSGPSSELNGGEDAEEEPVELPPPMKPIADPLMGGATALAGSNSSDDAQAKRVSLFHVCAGPDVNYLK